MFWFGVIMARVGTLLMAKGVFAPTDEFDLKNTRTPELDR